MEYKVGDILVCKKKNDKSITFNKSYEIVYLDSNYIVIINDKKWWNCYSINKDNNDAVYILDYFYLLSYVRKLKLVKLKNIK